MTAGGGVETYTNTSAATGKRQKDAWVVFQVCASYEVAPCRLGAAAPTEDLKREVLQKRSFKRRSRRCLNDSYRDSCFMTGAKSFSCQGTRLLCHLAIFFSIKAAINSAQVVLNVILWALSSYTIPPLGALSRHQSSKALEFLMCAVKNSQKD